MKNIIFLSGVINRSCCYASSTRVKDMTHERVTNESGTRQQRLYSAISRLSGIAAYSQKRLAGIL